MSARTYLDFDLQIDELDTSTFRAHVPSIRPRARPRRASTSFSALELEIFFLRIGRHDGACGASIHQSCTRRAGLAANCTRRSSDHLQACLFRSIDYAEQQGNRLRLRAPRVR